MSEFHPEAWLDSGDLLGLLRRIAKMTCVLSHQGNHHYQHNQRAATGYNHIKMVETQATNKWFVVWIECQQDARRNSANNLHSTMCVGVTQEPPKSTEAMASKIVTRFLGFRIGKILMECWSWEGNWLLRPRDREERVYIISFGPSLLVTANHMKTRLCSNYSAIHVVLFTVYLLDPLKLHEK